MAKLQACATRILKVGRYRQPRHDLTSNSKILCTDFGANWPKTVTTYTRHTDRQ